MERQIQHSQGNGTLENIDNKEVFHNYSFICLTTCINTNKAKTKSGKSKRLILYFLLHQRKIDVSIFLPLPNQLYYCTFYHSVIFTVSKVQSNIDRYFYKVKQIEKETQKENSTRVSKYRNLYYFTQNSKGVSYE